MPISYSHDRYFAELRFCIVFSAILFFPCIAIFKNSKFFEAIRLKNFTSRNTYFHVQTGIKKYLVKVVLFHIKKNVRNWDTKGRPLEVLFDVKKDVLSDVLQYANHFF